MWRTTGWKKEVDRNGVLVESKPVSGSFEAAGILVTRAVGEIDAPAQATFDMLVSPAGYAVIDPISKPEDHELPPLETYNWREGSRLEAAVATTNLPMMAVSEFVVLNAIDPAHGSSFRNRSFMMVVLTAANTAMNKQRPEGGNGH